MVYRLDTPGVENQAITNAKIDTGAVSTQKVDASINNALVPINGIIMYSGLQADIPANWAICDGNNGTPNLVNKFVVAAASFDVGTSEWRTAVDGTSKESGGAATKTLGTNELPSHTHGITDPGHQHTTNVDTGTLFHVGGSGQVNYGGAGTYPGTAFNMDDANTGITATDEEGVDATNKNLPPYFAIAYIMRIS